MVQKLKELILSNVKNVRKTTQDISTYSLVRPGNGFFYLKIYWKGKAQKGHKSAIAINLTFKKEDACSAIHAIEEVMNDSKNIEMDFDQVAKETNPGEWI